MHRDVLPPFVGVIAAGGGATRLGVHGPKSLITMHGRSLLERSVMSMRGIGVDQILVYTDRPGWSACTARAAAGARDGSSRSDDVVLRLDCGSDSTFSLVKHAAAIHPAARLVFMYGHSPRSNAVMELGVSAGNGVVVGGVRKTTRRDLLEIRRGLYFEPPVFVSSSTVLMSDASTWREFLEQDSLHADSIEIDGPPEFNDVIEMGDYSSYVRELDVEMSRTWTGPSSAIGYGPRLLPVAARRV